MKHLIIIPAYNESDSIERVVRSLLEQSSPAKKIVVVDDGSSDDTGAIVAGLAAQYDNLALVTNKNKDPRATGAKIVRAFNLGLSEQQVRDYDIISKFDADLEFPKDYLANIEAEFSSDQNLGLCGGACSILKDDKWVGESVAKTDHIRGALKSYRREAFEKMEGLKLFMGWDSADEFLLRFHGFKVKLLKDLHVKHFRETNELNGWVRTSKLNAQVFHNLRYGFVIGSVSALKRGLSHHPLLLSGMVTWLFFIGSYFKGNENGLSPEVGSFIRKYRWNTIFK